jgi:hypothetical protein
MGMGMPLNSMSNAILLLALGVGYIVFYLANKEGKTMKLLGNVIGAFIIVVAGTLVLTNILIGTFSAGAYCPISARACMKSKQHAMAKHKMVEERGGMLPPVAAKSEAK